MGNFMGNYWIKWRRKHFPSMMYCCKNISTIMTHRWSHKEFYFLLFRNCCQSKFILSHACLCYKNELIKKNFSGKFWWYHIRHKHSPATTATGSERKKSSAYIASSGKIYFLWMSKEFIELLSFLTLFCILASHSAQISVFQLPFW